MNKPRFGNIVWNEANKERLRGFIAKGWSVKRIALEMGITELSVRAATFKFTKGLYRIRAENGHPIK